jgi:hypothetical protein
MITRFPDTAHSSNIDEIPNPKHEIRNKFEMPVFKDPKPNCDGFAKSPSAVLRFIFRHCSVPLCTPHSSRFARLASGAFYYAVHLGDLLQSYQLSMSRVNRFWSLEF